MSVAGIITLGLGQSPSEILTLGYGIEGEVGGLPGYLVRLEQPTRKRRRGEYIARTSSAIPVGVKVVARCRYLPAPLPVVPVEPLVEVPAPPPLREPRTYTCRAIISVGVHWRGNARRRYTDEIAREERQRRLREESWLLGLPFDDLDLLM